MLRSTAFSYIWNDVTTDFIKPSGMITLDGEPIGVPLTDLKDIRIVLNWLNQSRAA